MIVGYVVVLIFSKDRGMSGFIRPKWIVPKWSLRCQEDEGTECTHTPAPRRLFAQGTDVVKSVKLFVNDQSKEYN